MIYIFDNATGVVSQVSGDAGRAFEEQLTAAGVSFISLGQSPIEVYVDITAEVPALRSRPFIDGEFSTNLTTPGEEITYTDMPRGILRVNGPEGYATFDHPGGDVELSFLLPGAYTVVADCFPYRHREWRISVGVPTNNTGEQSNG